MNFAMFELRRKSSVGSHAYSDTAPFRSVALLRDQVDLDERTGEHDSGVPVLLGGRDQAHRRHLVHAVEVVRNVLVQQRRHLLPRDAGGRRVVDPNVADWI